MRCMREGEKELRREQSRLGCSELAQLDMVMRTDTTICVAFLHFGS